MRCVPFLLHVCLQEEDGSVRAALAGLCAGAEQGGPHGEQHLQLHTRCVTCDMATLSQPLGVLLAGVPLPVRARHPLSGDPLPIFVAHYVVSGYGTGAVMGVPGHDQRDREFAASVGLPTSGSIVVEDGGEGDAGFLVNSGQFSGLSTSEGRTAILDHAKVRGEVSRVCAALSAHLSLPSSVRPCVCSVLGWVGAW